MPYSKMTGLSGFAYAVLLLFGLKDLSCSACADLILPPTKYGPVAGNQGHRLSESDLINILPNNPSFRLPSPSTSKGVSLISVLATSPYLMTSLPPSVIIKLINEVSSSPSLIRAIEPSTLASLIGALCSSPSLLKHASGATALIDLATAIVLVPGMETALPPPITIRLLSKIKDEASNALCSLAPAIRVQLIISACTPDALSSLKPTEIAFLVDLFSSTDCILTETPPYVLAAILKTIASSSALTIDICISRIVRLWYRISLLAPNLISVMTPEITQTLLAPFDISTINSQSPETLLQLIDVVTSFPYFVDIMGPSILSSILTRLSQPTVIKAISTKTIIKLLSNITLSNILTVKNIDAMANILNSIATISPLTISNIPPSVCFEYVTYLATGPLSAKTIGQFIDTLTNNPCLLAQLSPSLIGDIISFVVSSEQILNAISSNNIICFIESVTAFSPCLLQDTSSKNISKLLPLRLDSLSSHSFIKLLKSIASCPFLIDAFSDDQILNIFTMINSSSGIIRKIPSKVLVDILTQIFTTQKLTKIPLSIILDLMINIENQVPKVVCTIPSFAISAFTDFLGHDTAKLSSLLPADVTRLVYLLEMFPSILSKISVQDLNSILSSIVTLNTMLNAIPAGTKVDLFYSIYSTSPSILCSLSPKSILGIINSFDSFELLCTLSPQHLIKFTTILSGCPGLLKLLTGVTLTNLLDVLSVIPSTLSAIQSSVVINLLTSISSNAVLPASTCVRFLRVFSTVNLSLPCVIPTSVSAKLLDTLKSPDTFNESMSSDVENFVDLLITTPGLFSELPVVVMINLIKALAQTFTTVVPRTKIIIMFTQMNKVSPSILCSVPQEVLATVLNTLCSQTELNALPPAYVAALATIMSSSSCMLNLIPAPAFVSFLGLLSSSVEALGLIPPNTFANLLTKLLLTPSLLGSTKLSMIIPLLSTLFSTSGPSTECALSPVLLNALLVATCDVKTIYALEPTEVALLLNVTATVPCVLNAMPSLALDTLVSKLGSSPNFFAHVPPSLTASFLAAVASSTVALRSIRTMTLINALLTIALKQPSVLSILPLSSATTILATFDSLQVLGSVPTPLIGGLVQLILFSPNLFIAMPLSTLDCLLRFLTLSSTALGSLPLTTLIKFLTVLSSLPKLLSAISSITLTFFIDALSILFPEVLCNLPPPVVIALMGSITSNTALATSTPVSVNALISILNRSPCLITTLPISLLVFLITYLSAHPNLLSATTKFEVIKLVNQIQSPSAFPQIGSGGQPFMINRFDKLPQPQLPLSNINRKIFSNVNPVPEILPPNDFTNQTIYAIFNNKKEIDSDEKNNPEKSEVPKNLVPTLIYPKKSKGADIYIFPKNNKQSSAE